LSKPFLSRRRKTSEMMSSRKGGVMRNIRHNVMFTPGNEQYFFLPSRLFPNLADILRETLIIFNGMVSYFYKQSYGIGLSPPALLVNTSGLHSVTLLPVTIHCTSPLSRVGSPCV
jgi:hypothetical protein